MNLIAAKLIIIQITHKSHNGKRTQTAQKAQKAETGLLHSLKKILNFATKP